MSSKNIAIISIDPRDRGGVRTMVEEAWLFAQKQGEPHLFFISFEPALSAHLRPFKYQSSVEQGSWEGKSYTAIGVRWAFWEPGHYVCVRKQWKEFLKDYDYFFVVSGTPIAAHILCLLKKKYILWIASSYSDDRVQRVKKMGYARRCINFLTRPLMDIIEFCALKNAAMICTTSRYSQNLFSHLDKDKSQIVGVPLSGTIFAHEHNKKKQSAHHLIAIGRFSDPRKNIEMLMRVFRGVRQKIPDCTLTIIGSLPKTIKQDLERNNKKYDGILFITQRLSDHKLYDHIQQASLMLITSYQEGLSIVGMQALAKGVPVVSTDCGGVRDYIIDDQTGYLVAINDDQAMQDNICLLLEDDRKRVRMGNAGKKLVQDQYSRESVYQKFTHAFSHVYIHTTWSDI